MIRKLRIRFIVAAMLSLTIVLAIILTVAGIMNYHKIVSTADLTLSVLEENDGIFPEHLPLEIDSPETPFESRFFTVEYSARQQVLFIDLGRIAAVDQDTAVGYAQQAMDSGESNGFIDSYRFKATVQPDGRLRVIFLDCGRMLDSNRYLILNTALVSLGGFTLVFILLLVLSGRIVRPVAESYEKQKRFITDAGHEMKTPLAIINADSEALQMDIGDNEWLTDIYKQSSRMNKLIQNLILLARMDEENPNLQMIDLPFSDLVNETIQSFQAMFKTQGKSIDTLIQPLITVHGEDKSLRQLVSILLDNALKYSLPGSTVSLRLSQQGRRAVLTIQNPCAPMDPDDLSNLFDRFYRPDKSRNSASGGHGIGLSIAKAVVSGHKGTISSSAPAPGQLLIMVSLPASPLQTLSTKGAL